MRTILLTLLLSLFSLTQAQDLNIVDYGAVGDGQTLNTSFIQKAIDQVAKSGGRVIVPKGEFLTGSIILRSGVELHIEKGGYLLGSTNFDDYKSLNRWNALILADGQKDVAISGKGTIDGQGAELALKMDSMFYAGRFDSSQYSFPEKRVREQIRPQIIEFMQCHNIQVTGVRIRNSASWVQTYEQCTNIKIDDIWVDSDAYWNNDGLDILDCRNVSVTNSYINASDDGICLKSEEWNLTEYCDSIIIANCKIRSSGSAIKFGTSSVSAIRNVHIHDIRIFDTYRSAIAIEAVQGGVLEDILIENIRAKNTGNALFLRIGQIRNAKQPGTLKNVVIRNLKVKVPFHAPDEYYRIRGPVVPGFHNTIPSSITGLPGYNIQNVRLENISIIYPGRGHMAYANLPLDRVEDVPELPGDYPEFSMFGELPAWGLYVRHAEGLSITNLKLKVRNNDYRPAIVFDDVSNFEIQDYKIKGDTKPSPIFLHNSKAK